VSTSILDVSNGYTSGIVIGGRYLYYIRWFLSWKIVIDALLSGALTEVKKYFYLLMPTIVSFASIRKGKV
jgi:hypothetical protein